MKMEDMEEKSLRKNNASELYFQIVLWCHLSVNFYGERLIHLQKPNDKNNI